MYKPDSLREHLTAALHELQRDPHRLIVLISDGKVKSTASGSLSWRYDYTLRILITDWASHADAVFAPLLVWLQEHQWDLLSNNDKPGIRFEVEYMSLHSMDLLIELDLNETVLVRERQNTSETPGTPNATGALELHHKKDIPGPLDMPMREQWSFWLKDELLAEWSYDPRRPLPAEQG